MLFTFASYKCLLEMIRRQGFEIFGIEELLIRRRENRPLPHKFVVIRHDVDYYPGRAVTMAAIEAAFGIQTTYYVRRHFFESALEPIRQIAAQGHQIGYHYEEIDTHQKAPNQQVARDALGFFVGALLDLNNLGFPIKTICPHGNPLSDVDNRQVVHLLKDERNLDHLAFTFDRELVRQKISERLVGDASIDITGADVDVYIPDTGRFNPRFNLKDHIDGCPTLGIRSLAHLEGILREAKRNRIYMNMHPDRWSGDIGHWLFDFAFDWAKNVVKVVRGKRVYQGRLVGTKSRKYHQTILKSMKDKRDAPPGAGS